MAVYNLGSVNADHFYRVPHLPAPGETLAAQSLTRGLGGKGANMSVALARAGARVFHIGAVGPDGDWARAQLQTDGVDTRFLVQTQDPTGHAIINVDPRGENQIVLFPGANHTIPNEVITQALSQQARADDWLLMQNETNGQTEAAKFAAAKGMRVIYAAAPFEAEKLSAVLPHVTVLVVNEVEAAQMSAHLGQAPESWPVQHVAITKGAHGVDLITPGQGATQHIPAPKVTAIDTTGAGDTFTGFFAAGLDQGQDPAHAAHLASRAAALMVTRPGTAQAIPTLAEVETQM